MPTFHFNKLVRGKLPEMYKDLNQKILSRRLIGRELLLQIRSKVVEETEEIPLETIKLPLEDDERTAIIREIGDAKQALKDMQELLGISDEEVEAARLEKFDQKGGFLDGVFVEMIELQDDDPWIEYYRKEPYKYPEQGVEGPSVAPGEYVHYKSSDMHYEVIGVGRNTETGEKYAVYKTLYEVDDAPDFWVRPLGMFLSDVMVDGKAVKRFTKVDE